MTVLPFALQDWHGLVDGSLLFHFTIPPRTDSVAFVHLWLGWPTSIGAVAWLACGAWLALRPEPARAPVVAALGLLALFLAGRQGHPNYWWLLPPLLLMVWALNASNRLISNRSTMEPSPKGPGERMNKANKQALKILGLMSGFWTLFPILSGFVPPIHFLGATFYGPLGLNWETMRALTATLCVIYAGMGTTAGYILATAYLRQQVEESSAQVTAMVA